MSDKKKRRLTDVMHSSVPLETPDEHARRKAAEFDEEGEAFHAHPKPVPQESFLSKVGRMAHDASASALNAYLGLTEDKDKQP